MSRKATEIPLEELRTRLRSAGLRSTGPRVAVLRRLLTATAPMSHGELTEELAPLGFDRATLYRNLMDLAEVGLVSRTDLGDHVWRFEIRGDGGVHGIEHPHFTCTDCGTVACLPGVSVQISASESAPPASLRAAGSTSVEVHLKGRCDDCT